MDKRNQAFKVSRLRVAILFVSAVLYSSNAFAASGPSQFSISGGLYQANGNPITSSNVNFRVQVMDPTGNCVIYSENHLGQDLSNTKGGFALTVGTGSSRTNNIDGLTELAANVFENNGVTTVIGCAPQTFVGGDQRVVRISYDLGGGYVAMNPDIPMTASAYSMVAETLQGKRPADLIQVRNDNSSYFLDQTNVETVFNSTNWPRLQALLNGSSTQYMVSNPGAPVSFNNQRITSVANPSANTDAANKQYVDGNIGGYASVLTGIGTGLGAGSTLVWDATDNRWEIGTPNATDVTKLPLAGGTMSGAITMAGYDIYNTGHITMGNQRLLQLGTFNNAQEGALALGVADAGKVLYNTQADSLRVWNGSAYYSVVTSIPVLSVAGKTGAVSLNAMDISGLGTAATRDVGVLANQILALDSSVRIPAVDGGLLTNVNATRLQGRFISSTAPTADQVLRWNAGLVQWEASTISFVDTGITDISGDVLATGSGAVVATISTNAVTNTKIANDQVTSNKLKSTGIAINRLLITDSSTGATIDYANCAQDQILKFNAALGWGCSNDVGLASAVTYVGSGTGLLGGPITATGTLSVDVGVGANQIVQLDSASRLPAVDGGLVTNSNAQRLQGRALSSAAPNAFEVLNWNASLAQWEPVAIPSAPVQSVNGKVGVVTILLSDIAGAGDITDVTAGTALTGGGVSGNVTLNVDVGTGPNQVVQLDSTSRLPAVDGYLLSNINGSALTNVNAERLQTRAVSSVAPTDAQVLTWNAAAAEWRAVAVPSAPVQSVNGKTGVVTIDLADIAGAGDITQVVAGLGATGGGTAGVVTVGVDAGVGANQIVQLDSSSRLPAVDGGLVTNSNAQRLQGRALSAVAPNNLEVLNWNSGSAQWEPIAIPSAPVQSVNGKTGVVTIDLADIAGAGDITDVSAGNALLGGGTAGNVTLAVNTGVGANQIVQLDSSSRLPAVDGGLVTNANAQRLQGRALSSVAPNAFEVLNWNASLAQWEPVAIPSAPVQSVNGKTGVVTIDLADIAGAGDITQVVAGLGSTGGGTAGVVTVGVDAGVGANQIVQLDSSSRLPAVDGGLVTNSNAQRLQGRALSAVAPNNLEVLNWNSGSAQWEPIAIPSAPVQSVNGKTGVVTIDLADIAGAGDITDVTAGNALLGGGTAGNVTLAVNTGTGANQIMQLDSSSRAPGVDGGLMTNLNAVRLQARAVSATAPTDAQVLTWNAAASEWRAVTATAAPVQSVNGKTGVVTIELSDIAGAGDITQVVAGLGSTGGGTAGVVTVGVDAGVGANQIVQLDSSSRLPAVDGGLVTNSNAQRLQGRALSAVAPNNLEVLNWNSGSAQWEPIAIPSAPVQSVNGKTGVVTIDLADIAGAGDITDVTAGVGILGGGNSGNVTVSVNVGTGANQIVQLDSSSRLPALDAGLLSNVNAVRLQARAVSSTAPTADQVLRWNNGLAQWEPSTVSFTDTGMTSISGDVVANGSGAVVATINANAITNTKIADDQITSNKLKSTGIAINRLLITDSSTGATLDYASCAQDQILKFNTALGWGCAADAGVGAAVTYIGSGNGLVGGPISATGTLAVDAGVGANQIVQLDSSSRLPAVDGGLVTNSNAQRLQGRAISAVAPNNLELLNWNSGSAQWEPIAIPSAPVQSVNGKTGVVTINLADIAGAGDITDVTAGNALLGGGTAGNVTLAVNTGTGANQIMQLDSSSRAPGVDGGLMTNLNAVRLQAHAVSSTAPTDAQVLTWNAAASEWRAVTATAAPVQSVNGKTGVVTIELADIAGAGDITQVVAGLGATGGGTSGTVTVGVDAGVGANQIVQLDSSSRLPAVDGGLVANSNAQRLQGRALSSVAPNNLEVLNWNSGSAQWEPIAIPSAPVQSVNGKTGVVTINLADIAGAGDITDVTAGNALLGGGTAGNVTLAVNTGTGANQIMQLDSSSRAPGVDGGLMTNLNAVRLQARAVSATAPTDAQVLTWNAAASEWRAVTATAAPVQSVNGKTGVVTIELADIAGAGDITDVTAGVGMLGGGSSGNVTVSVNVGTGANQIVQLDSSARLPSVDGGLVTNSNAQRLQARAVSNAAPSADQVLMWNSGTSIWEPQTLPAGASGDITDVTAGYGLLGGGSSGNVTLSLAFPMEASGTGTAAAPMYSFDGDTDNGMYKPFINELAFSTAGTERLKINGSGNVGIGTSAPTALLHVAGDIRSTTQVIAPVFTSALNSGLTVQPGNSTGGGSALTLTAGTGSLGAGGSVNISASGGAGMSAGSVNISTPSGNGSGSISMSVGNNLSGTTGGAINLTSGSTGAFRGGNINLTTGTGALGAGHFVFTNGDVGIGTSSPTAGTILDIAGVGTANSSVIIPRDTTALRPPVGVNGMIRYNTTSQRFEAYEAGGWTNMITSIAGTGDITDVTAGYGLLGGGSSGNVTLSLAFPMEASGTGTAAAPMYSFNGDSDNGMFNPFINELAFSTAGTERLKINGSGNVGIGTSTPANLLEVRKNQNTETAIWVANDSDAGTSGVAMYFKNNGGNPGYITLPSSSSTVGSLYQNRMNFGASNSSLGVSVFSEATYGDFRLYTGGYTANEERLRVTASGSVGIGAAAPTAGTILDVAGTGAAFSSMIIPRDTTALRPTTGVNGMMRFNTTTNKFEVYEGTWQNMIASLAGVGDITDVTAGYGLLGGGSSGNVTLSLAFPMEASGTGTAAAPMYSFNGDSDNGMYKPFINELAFSTAGTERLKINGSGNVGIGTASPGSLLSLGSNSASNTPRQSIQINNDGIGSPSATNSYSNGDKLILWNEAGTKTAIGVDDFALWFQNGGNTNSYIGFFTGATSAAPDERMRITSGGRVGIGTSAPTAGTILELNGTGAAFSSMIVPRETAALRPTVGVNGMIRYNTTSQRFEAYEAGGWTNMITSIAGAGDITDVTAGYGLLGGGSSGNVTLSLAFPMAASGTGTAAAPMYSFAGDNDNGMYKPFINELAFSTGGTERLKIDGSGNIGIGTSPQTNFHVRTTSGDADFLLQSSNATGGSATVSLWSMDGTGTQSYSYMMADQSGNMLYESGTGAHIFGRNSGSNTMNLNSQGQLMIGAGGATSGTLLDVNGTGAAFSSIIIPRETTALRPTVGVNGMMRFNTTSNKFEVYEGTWQNMISSGGGGSGDFLAAGTVPMTGNLRLGGNWLSNDGGNEGIRVANNGNVGVGTAPSAPFHVAGTSGDLVRLENSGAAAPTTIRLVAYDSGSLYREGYFAFNPAPGTNQSYITLGSAAENIFNVKMDGRVGVRTIAPTTGTSLDVTGTGVAFSSMIVPRDTTALRPTTGVNGMMRFNTTSNKFEVYEGTWQNMIGGGGGGGSGDFMANGSVPMTGALLATAGTGATAPAYSFNGDTDNGMYLRATDTLAFATNGTQRLTIDSTGNTGIGVNNPTAKLQVAGQIISQQTTIASGATVNFANGNTQVLDSVGGTDITLVNMVHGGSYTLVIRDTTVRTYNFLNCTSSFFKPSNGDTEDGTRTIYTIMAIQNGGSTECYISWATGFN